MKAKDQLKKTLGTIFIVFLAAIVVADGFLNSDDYRANYGSETLKHLSIGLGFFLWIWMLVDLMAKIVRTSHIQKPWLWVALVVMTYVVGAFVYYIVIYLPLLKKQDSEPTPPSRPPTHTD